MVKILRLATDPAHVLRRRYHLKTKKHQSDVSTNLDYVDVDRHVSNFDHKDGEGDVKALRVDDDSENADPTESSLEEHSNENQQQHQEHLQPPLSVSTKSNIVAVEVDMLNFDSSEPSSSSPMNSKGISSSSSKLATPSMAASTLNREELVANREKETEMKVKEALNFARMVSRD